MICRPRQSTVGECLGEDDRRSRFLRHVPEPWPCFFKGDKARRAGEIALVAARYYAEASVPLTDIAQRVRDNKKLRVNLAVGDLVADSGQPWHGTAVQLKRSTALSHQHCVTVVVAELVAEKVGEVGDDARVADQLAKRPGKTVQRPNRNLAVAVPPRIEEAILSWRFPEVVLINLVAPPENLWVREDSAAMGIEETKDSTGASSPVCWDRRPRAIPT